MSEFRLPDGREPLRFDVGRAAFYESARTKTGEVRYMFSMIRYMQKHRQKMSKAEIIQINREIAKRRLERDPDCFRKLGRKGGQGGRKKSQV